MCIYHLLNWRCDLRDKALEGELADEQVGRLLVVTDLTEDDGWVGNGGAS